MKKSGLTPALPTALSIALVLAAGADVLYEYFVTLPGFAAIARSVSQAGSEDVYPDDAVPATVGQLFGVQTPTPAPVLPVAPSIVVSSSPRLVVSGILGGGNGIAIIVDESGHEGVYQTGDLIPGGARLEAVLENAIQVFIEGNRYLVRIDWEEANAISTTVSVPVSPDGDSPETAASPTGMDH